jgi:DNA-binding LacI/PurR family transcriptional regulator
MVLLRLLYLPPAHSLLTRVSNSVVGVDDIPAGRLSAPPLSTVATGMAVFGAHLADLVSASLNGGPRPARPADDIVAVIRRESS